MLIIENLGASSQDTILSELDILLLHPIIQNMCICFKKKGGGVIRNTYLHLKIGKFQSPESERAHSATQLPEGPRLDLCLRGRSFTFLWSKGQKFLNPRRRSMNLFPLAQGLDLEMSHTPQQGWKQLPVRSWTPELCHVQAGI